VDYPPEGDGSLLAQILAQYMPMQPLDELLRDQRQQPPPAAEGEARAPELGGPAGPEPTRYGDWERRGRCIDF
jgi:hypothetical protein